MVAFLLLLIGFYLIVRGGDFLVRSALRLSHRTGASQVLIGATFVSLATTLPEIVISIYAILTESEGLAVGNAIGGMMVSLALIFALYAVFQPRAVSREQLMLKSFFLFFSIALVIVFSLGGRIGLWEGFILGATYFLYLGLTTNQGKRQSSPITKTNNSSCDAVCKTCYKRKEIITGFLVGQALLLLGAFLLVQNSERLSAMIGLSETVVGFTLVALGTSTPEFVTVISSIRQKSGELAIGNIIGSNIINATLLLGICGVASALDGAPLGISPHTMFVSLPVLVVASLIAVLPIIIKGRIYRTQGVALLLLYCAYMIYLVTVKPL